VILVPNMPDERQEGREEDLLPACSAADTAFLASFDAE
jgi:hypothetical protein